MAQPSYSTRSPGLSSIPFAAKSPHILDQPHGLINPEVPLVQYNALPALFNNAEGGTAGTTITTGNSGGASGAPFTTVTLGTGFTGFYDADAAHGTLSHAWQGNGSLGSATTIKWLLNGYAPSGYIRQYVKLNAYPTGNNAVSVARFVDDAAGVSSSQVYLHTNGSIGMGPTQDSNGLAAGPYPLNQWMRIEHYLSCDMTGAAVEWVRVWWTDLDATDNPDLSISTTSGTTATPFYNQISINMTASTSTLAGWTMRTDDWGFSQTAALGPVGSPKVRAYCAVSDVMSSGLYSITGSGFIQSPQMYGGGWTPSGDPAVGGQPQTNDVVVWFAETNGDNGSGGGSTLMQWNSGSGSLNALSTVQNNMPLQASGFSEQRIAYSYLNGGESTGVMRYYDSVDEYGTTVLYGLVIAGGTYGTTTVGTVTTASIFDDIDGSSASSTGTTQTVSDTAVSAQHELIVNLWSTMNVTTGAQATYTAPDQYWQRVSAPAVTSFTTSLSTMMAWAAPNVTAPATPSYSATASAGLTGWNYLTAVVQGPPLNPVLPPVNTPNRAHLQNRTLMYVRRGKSLTNEGWSSTVTVDSVSTATINATASVTVAPAVVYTESAAISATASMTDAPIVVETATVAISATATVTDSAYVGEFVTVSSAASVTVGITITVIESITTSVSASVTVTPTVYVTETAVSAVSSSATMTVSPTVVETLTLAIVSTASVTATGSLYETGTLAISATATVSPITATDTSTAVSFVPQNLRGGSPWHYRALLVRSQARESKGPSYGQQLIYGDAANFISSTGGWTQQSRATIAQNTNPAYSVVGAGTSLSVIINTSSTLGSGGVRAPDRVVPVGSMIKYGLWVYNATGVGGTYHAYAQINWYSDYPATVNALVTNPYGNPIGSQTNLATGWNYLVIYATTPTTMNPVEGPATARLQIWFSNLPTSSNLQFYISDVEAYLIGQGNASFPPIPNTLTRVDSRRALQMYATTRRARISEPYFQIIDAITPSAITATASMTVLGTLTSSETLAVAANASMTVTDTVTYTENAAITATASMTATAAVTETTTVAISAAASVTVQAQSWNKSVIPNIRPALHWSRRALRVYSPTRTSGVPFFTPLTFGDNVAFEAGYGSWVAGSGSPTLSQVTSTTLIARGLPGAASGQGALEIQQTSVTTQAVGANGPLVTVSSGDVIMVRASFMYVPAGTAQNSKVRIGLNWYNSGGSTILYQGYTPSMSVQSQTNQWISVEYITQTPTAGGPGLVNFKPNIYATSLAQNDYIVLDSVEVYRVGNAPLSWPPIPNVVKHNDSRLAALRYMVTTRSRISSPPISENVYPTVALTAQATMSVLTSASATTASVAISAQATETVTPIVVMTETLAINTYGTMLVNTMVIEMITIAPSSSVSILVQVYNIIGTTTSINAHAAMSVALAIIYTLPMSPISAAATMSVTATHFVTAFIHISAVASMLFVLTVLPGYVWHVSPGVSSVVVSPPDQTLVVIPPQTEEMSLPVSANKVEYDGVPSLAEVFYP